VIRQSPLNSFSVKVEFAEYDSPAMIHPWPQNSQGILRVSKFAKEMLTSRKQKILTKAESLQISFTDLLLWMSHERRITFEKPWSVHSSEIGCYFRFLLVGRRQPLRGRCHQFLG